MIYPREEELDPDSQDILRISDVVIMELSTIALEAAILKKPVISINFSDKPGYRGLLEYRENLDQVLAEAMENPEKFIKQQEEFVEGYHPGKGNAVTYLKEMVLGILKQGDLPENYY